MALIKCLDNNLTQYFNNKYDNLNAIVEIHSGAGGKESYDWSKMLYRMYCLFLTKYNYKIVELYKTMSDKIYIKSIYFKVVGKNAYGYLKSEHGVHRLIRISPFDSSKRRHTTFSAVSVTPEIINNKDIEIKKNDIKIETFKSSGAGGQHVNTTDSAVRLTYIPQNIVICCQSERSQILNKEIAFNILKSKLILIEENKQKKQYDNFLNNNKKIEWGNQIRSYVFYPYLMVKDHRTNISTNDAYSVIDGNIEIFINEFIKKQL